MTFVKSRRLFLKSFFSIFNGSEKHVEIVFTLVCKRTRMLQDSCMLKYILREKQLNVIRIFSLTGSGIHFINVQDPPYLDRETGRKRRPN